MSRWFKLLKGEHLHCSDCGDHLKKDDDVFVEIDPHIVIFRCTKCEENKEGER